MTKIGENIFRDYPSDSSQGNFAAEFIYNDMKKDQVAIIYVQNEWGTGIKDVFSKKFKELGGEIVYTSGILQTETDFRTEISKLKLSNAEAIYFPVYPKNAVSGLKQMRELDMAIPVIGGDILGGDEVVKSGYAEDLIYITGKIGLPEEFKARINSLEGYNDLNLNMVAPTGYDGAMILLSTIEKVGTDKEGIIKELANTSYHGISNPVIEFDENGDLKTPTFEVKVIKGGESVHYNATG